LAHVDLLEVDRGVIEESLRGKCSIREYLLAGHLEADVGAIELTGFCATLKLIFVFVLHERDFFKFFQLLNQVTLQLLFLGFFK